MILQVDMYKRSPSMVASAVSWYLHPLRKELKIRGFREPPIYQVLAFVNSDSSVVSQSDSYPFFSVLDTKRYPALREQEIRYLIERCLLVEVYERYCASIAVFPKEPDLKYIRRQYQLTDAEMKIDEFIVDDASLEMQQYATAFSKLDVDFAVLLDRQTKTLLDNIVSPKFLEVSQLITGVKADVGEVKTGVDTLKSTVATKSDVSEIKELLSKLKP